MKTIQKTSFLLIFLFMAGLVKGQDQILDNNTFIYFKDNTGTNDGVRIGRHSGNALRIRYKANSFAFDALSNHPVLIKNSSDQNKIQFHPAGESFFNGGNLGIGTTNPTFKLEVNSGVSNNVVLFQSSDPYAIINLRDDTSTDDELIRRHGDKTSIYSGGINHIRLTGTGNVGIGVSSPTEKLQVGGDIGLNGSENTLYQVGSSQNSLTGLSVRAVTNPPNGNNIFTIESAGENSRFGVTQQNGAWIKDGLRIGAQFHSDMPNLNGNLIVNAKVGVGTTTPDEKLTVKGKIHAEEVKVDLSVPGPDYVFEADYDLLSLEEIEAYIQSEKHLPEIPTAKEMESNGVELGGMNMLLLKKIEELTLHVISINKRQHLLIHENTNLKEEIKSLKNK